jgi:DNA-binding response OmpR family regulator
MTQPTQRTIFIFDDSAVILAAAKAYFEANGYLVHTAIDLRELEGALATTSPDLIVLDVQMPEIFGDDVAQVLRNVRDLKVPIVLFSDIDEADLARRGREAGVASVPKRAGLPALLAEVASRLGGAS